MHNLGKSEWVLSQTRQSRLSWLIQVGDLAGQVTTHLEESKCDIQTLVTSRPYGPHLLAQQLYWS